MKPHDGVVCALCDKVIYSEGRSLHAKGVNHNVHKACLRKATQRQLIDKRLISPNNKSWWTIYGDE